MNAVSIAKDALWGRHLTAAPKPRTPSERQYSDRRLQSDVGNSRELRRPRIFARQHRSQREMPKDLWLHGDLIETQLVPDLRRAMDWTD